MKIRLLQVLLFATVLVSLSACLSKVVLEDDLIVQQNEAKIQQYISAKKLNTQKASNGVYYAITKANPTGRQMVLGDTVRLHYVISRLDDFKVDSSSVLKKQPFTFLNNGLNTNIFLKMLPYMREGEQATFILPSDLAGDSQAFPNLPANSPIRCDISFYKSYSEEANIDAYVVKNNITITEKTAEGVRYIRNQAGVSDLVTGKILKIKYTGKYLSGKVFDTNVGKTDSLSLTVGATTGFVKGFILGVSKMRLGEKATIIFASPLGYGRIVDRRTNATIPDESSLIFDIEIVAQKDK
jgi:FKBP-type peptidyl-prolyl cis-trans isomerase